MITEKDLQEAIAECQGQRNPNASTCIKLAAFYIIKDHLFPDENRTPPVYSFLPSPSLPQGAEGEGEEVPIQYESETEFWQRAKNIPMEKLMPIIDEAVSAVQLIQPRLYASILRKLEDA